ncbi:MAG TPA: carbohydrate kinase family protein [Nitriliruptoraceae bacterium]|nr:carbohydrate kinase family protein [Nitriliruptoraceae bacterium]
MRIAVTGSIATDWLMTFPGRITEQLVEGQLERVSLSFLVDELEVRRGGAAANIAFGLSQYGQAPMLVGSVGEDFNADYRGWLDDHGVDTSSVRVSETKHTARFLCTTDDEQNQIASFYTGAMEEARRIRLRPIVEEASVDLVVISPNDPSAMIRHTHECRELGVPFMADPGQQIARMPGSDVRKLVDDAQILITNDYEKALLERKTGWSDEEVLERVGMRITTVGPRGSILESNGGERMEVPTVPERRRADPTGVGDGFRAGLLTGIAWGLGMERAAQVGSLTATYVLEHVGTQEYGLERTSWLERFINAYGTEAGAQLEGVLTLR